MHDCAPSITLKQRLKAEQHRQHCVQLVMQQCCNASGTHLLCELPPPVHQTNFLVANTVAHYQVNLLQVGGNTCNK